MNRLLLGLSGVAVALAFAVFAGDGVEGQTLTYAPRTSVRDEGTLVASRGYLNFTGASVTCTDDAANNEVDCAISGGSGGGNFLEVSVNLGADGGLVYRTTVTGQTWVTGTSQILCSPFATTADGQTIETIEASGVQAVASNRVVGTGFDLAVYTPHGATGIYRFHCTGS